MRKCLICEKGLRPAPTDEPWFEWRNAGLHYACIDRVYDILQAIRAAGERPPIMAMNLPLGPADPLPNLGGFPVVVLHEGPAPNDALVREVERLQGKLKEET